MLLTHLWPFDMFSFISEANESLASSIKPVLMIINSFYFIAIKINLFAFAENTTWTVMCNYVIFHVVTWWFSILSFFLFFHVHHFAPASSILIGSRTFPFLWLTSVCSFLVSSVVAFFPPFYVIDSSLFCIHEDCQFLFSG